MTIRTSSASQVSHKVLYGIAGASLLSALWEAAYRLGSFSSVLLPSLGSVAEKTLRLVASGSVIVDLRFTLTQLAVSFSLAAILGTMLGLCMGSFDRAYRTIVPLVDFFRSVPITSLYPVFVLALGIGSAAKIAMAFVASIWIVSLNAAYGVRQSSPIRAQMAFLYGASRWQVFFLVRFFDALPQTVVGLRVALSYALVVEILAEMFMGSQHGLGQRITEAYTTYKIDELYAIVILTGSLGLLINKAFEVVEKKLLYWK